MGILNFDMTLLMRLVAAMVLGGVIGLERSERKQDAGFRTHIILCIGAALVMILSECIVKEYGISGEIMRMGAQVISGIGFLGVGSIIVDGNRVRGITTAAGLWTTACVGLAVGAGYYLIAIFTVVLMLFTVIAMRPIARRLWKKRNPIIIHVLIPIEDDQEVIMNELITGEVAIYHIKFEKYSQQKRKMIVFAQQKLAKKPQEIIAILKKYGDISELILA
jgi:putative Mg2+ transporter-C (MgtC) family protein